MSDISYSPHEEIPALREAARTEVAKIVLSHGEAVELTLIAALAGGHVLLEGPPGTAKTLLAYAIARVLGVPFRRVQFTPDTSPTEITGRTVFVGGEARFEPGTLFTNVLLADEINRTPPKTQAALLEAMQEGQVTVDGKTHWLPRPFLVIATQNPFEHEGVFALPESQLDRFFFKVILTYGSEEDEVRMLQIPHRGIAPDMLGDILPLLGDGRFMRVQDTIDQTEVPEPVARFLIALIRKTRELPGVVLGASPRAAIHLVAASKASARLAGRDSVIVDDVVAMAPHVLAHRLIVEGMDPLAVVRDATDLALPAANVRA